MTQGLFGPHTTRVLALLVFCNGCTLGMFLFSVKIYIDIYLNEYVYQ